MDNALSFKDILKNSVLNSEFFSTIYLSDIIMGLMVTLILSMFVFFIYRKTYSGVIYNYGFNASLVLMALITSMIIMTISSNLVLSLGMVGALSIVRFRTAVKEPIDIIFMFWAISLGITTGAGLYAIALTGTLFIGMVSVLLMRYKNTNNIFLLIIHYHEEAKENLFMKINELDYKIKSKTISKGMTELTLELKLVGANTSFMEDISEIKGILNTSLVNYNGNFVE